MSWTTRRTRMLIAGLAVTAAVPAAVASANHQPGHQGGGGQANNVSIDATTPITFGRSTTISGKVTGNGSGGVAVDLEADRYPYADNEFTKVASTATDANGNYTFTQEPQFNTRYRAVAKASPTVTSSAAVVLVRLRVSRRVSDRTPKAGTRVRFSGTVCPEHDGAVAHIQRRTSTGRYRTVARTSLRDSGGPCSRYARKVRVRRDGAYRVRVPSLDEDHATGTSRRVTLNAH